MPQRILIEQQLASNLCQIRQSTNNNVANGSGVPRISPKIMQRELEKHRKTQKDSQKKGFAMAETTPRDIPAIAREKFETDTVTFNVISVPVLVFSFQQLNSLE